LHFTKFSKTVTPPCERSQESIDEQGQTDASGLKENDAGQILTPISREN
jgi:hypothetical protein